jgi:hypothetical protein
MILGIVAISAFSRVQRAKYGDYSRRRGRYGDPRLLDPAQPSPRELGLQKEVDALKDRIHVLERIATDGRGSRALADEIESLRDR